MQNNNTTIKITIKGNKYEQKNNGHEYKKTNNKARTKATGATNAHILKAGEI